MSRIRIGLLLLFWGLSLLTPLPAQERPFLKWSTTDGLAQSQVRCLHEDPLGYLWIGTLGGVSKFNGKDFVNYSRRDGLASNQINAIASLANQNLAFGSIGALTVFDGQNFEVFPLPEGFEKAQINAFCTDCNPAGQLVIASEAGVLRFDGKAFTVLFTAKDLDDPHVKRLIKRGDHCYLFTKSSVYRYPHDAPGLERLVSAEQLGKVSLMDACAADGEGWLLASIGKGILLYTGSELQTLYGPEEGLTRNVTGIIAAGDGQYWAKSRDGFIDLSFQDGTWTAEMYNEADGLDNTDVRALHADASGNLWLGTYGGGLRKFIARGVTLMNARHGLSGDIVMSILPGPDGAWWLSTYDNGISLMSENGISKFGLADGLKSTRIWTSAVDRQGRYWFGSSGGLSLLEEDGRFRSFGKEDGLPHQQVLSLLPSSGESLLIGTARGLARLTERDGQYLIEAIPEVPEVKVRSIRAHPDGSLWLATNDGLFKLEGKQMTRFGETNGLPDNSVFCLEVSPAGVVWVGTESGLVRIRESENFEVIPLQGGFGANHINFLVFGEDDTLWLGTNDGLFVSQNHHDERSTWRHLGRHDGIVLPETNQNAVFINDSILWFGTSGALTQISLNELSKDLGTGDLNAVIRDMRVNLLAPDWKRYEVEKNRYGLWPEELKVPYQDKHFTFFFDAPSLRNPDNIRFQYYLEGIDDDWEPVTETEQVGYSQLPFGEYTFHVRAVDVQERSGAASSFSFAIAPPLWLRWWFILLEVLLLAGIIVAISRRRRLALIEKYEKEQLQFKSRMLSLEQQSLNSSMNRHFIFNALNAIQYYINRQDRLSANRYLTSFAKLIRKNLDSSQANMSTLHEELERLQLYLKLEQMRFEDRFDYTLEVDDSLDAHELKIPAMLLQPFLENSIWHGLLPKEGKGSVSLHVKPFSRESYTVEIFDNGIGVKTSMESKQGNEDHISQGMKITAGRVELLQKMTQKTFQIIGPEELKTEYGSIKGTLVQLIMPLDLEEK